MGDVWFYHLTETSAEGALPRLLAQAMGKGWAIELRGSNPARMEHLDRVLWDGPPDAFLPHGLAGGAHDGDQPVLLSVAAADGMGQGGLGRTLSGDEVAARACLMLVDGAPFDPAEAGLTDRICVVFDAMDTDQMANARNQWRMITAAGLAAQYWAQEDGRWTKKQERAAG